MKRFIGDTEHDYFFDTSSERDEKSQKVRRLGSHHIANAGKMVECHCAAPSCQCYRLGLTQEEEAK